MSKELGNDAQAISLVSMNGLIVFDKRGLEKFIPHTIELAKTLANETEEFIVGAFL